MNNLERFTERAASYVASRPSYPLEAVDAILAGLGDPGELVVADLGAGTGISSRLIASRGPRVLAVEPNAAMRAAAAPDPRVAWIDGTAEATTLGDDAADVAVAFQAWHWVDHPAAVAEARRIVGPGGRLAVAYNERDERDAFTAAYGDIVRRFAQDDTERRRADALAAVAAIDPERSAHFSFVNEHPLTRAGLHQRADSASYLPRSGELADAMHGAIDDLLDRAGAAPVRLQLVTLVVRVDL